MAFLFILMTQKKDFINLIVDEFYRVATTDILIGHHFRKIALKETPQGHPLRPPLEAFAHHLPRIKSFWYIQLLGEAKDPAQAPFELIQLHRELSIRMGELNRWLLLFREILKVELAKNADSDEIEKLGQAWQEKLNLFEERFKKLLF